MTDDFRAPVRADGDGFVFDIPESSATVILSLVDDLEELIREGSDVGEVAPALERLFPPASDGDAAANAEYQNLMRDELLQSKAAAFTMVRNALGTPGTVISAGEMHGTMQAINSLRLVLGTIIDVSDEADDDAIDPAFDDSAEYHLYGFLSYLLEWCVDALSGDLGET